MAELLGSKTGGNGFMSLLPIALSELSSFQPTLRNRSPFCFLHHVRMGQCMNLSKVTTWSLQTGNKVTWLTSTPWVKTKFERDECYRSYLAVSLITGIKPVWLRFLTVFDQTMFLMSVFQSHLPRFIIYLWGSYMLYILDCGTLRLS